MHALARLTVMRPQNYGFENCSRSVWRRGAPSLDLYRCRAMSYGTSHKVLTVRHRLSPLVAAFVLEALAERLSAVCHTCLPQAEVSRDPDADLDRIRDLVNEANKKVRATVSSSSLDSVVWR